MTATPIISRWQHLVLWIALLLYLLARISQLGADRLPTLLIVLLHVVPPAVFAMVHGSILYRVRGMLAFTGLCLGVAGLCESVGLRTGFPFGHYVFTSVMGPKIQGLPFMLVLAYLGIGYCSWVVSLLILGYRSQPLAGARVVALPVLASFVMLAWDLAMDADWATVDKAWIWQSGGAYFGVPVSNFCGWYLTAYLFFQAFALYRSARPAVPNPASRSFWRAPILVYAICALGNLLIVRLPMAPMVVTDASGERWRTADILQASMLVSLLVMGSMALLAWLRLREDEAGLASAHAPAIR